MAKVSIDSKLMDSKAASMVLETIWETLASLGQVRDSVEVVTVRDAADGGIDGKIVVLGPPRMANDRARYENTFTIQASVKGEELKKKIAQIVIRRVYQILQKQLGDAKKDSVWLTECRDGMPDTPVS